MLGFRHGGNGELHGAELDFSANINPLGMPERVKKAVVSQSDCWENYPDPYCTRLKKRLSEHEDISAEQIVCGNGADDLIYRIVMAFKPESALICAPSFGEYRKALEENRCAVKEYVLSESDGFEVSKSILSSLEGIDMAFICTPNNPTGRTIAPDLLCRIAEKCLTEDIMLVCDECFLDFVENSSLLSIRNFLNKRIIILKAFTKIYAMAGLRLGYAVFGSSEIAAKIQNCGQYWSVSSPAQTAGIAALDEVDYIQKTVGYIRNERKYLSAELAGLGLTVYPSDANFLLFRSNLPLDKQLLQEKILIRSCDNYNGLGEEFFRIAVRTHDENMKLISALRRILNG